MPCFVYNIWHSQTVTGRRWWPTLAQVLLRGYALSYDDSTIYRVSQNSLYRVHCHKTKTLYTECPKIRFTESIVIWRTHYISSVPKSFYTVHCLKTKTLYTECPKIRFTESIVVRRIHYIPSVPKSLYPVHYLETKTLYTECPKIRFTESIVLRRKHYTPSVPKFILQSPLS
jgi:phage-related protein